ncbi:putative Purple acid phosphatase 22 [Nannochloris sp. 'desiccata']|nr:putative Purple acid phosphatase 22 [Chlorella desiccata (nom. nud.)]
MCRGSNSVIALLHVGMLICLLPVTQADVTTIFKRREATPQLPLDDTRLRRNDDAGAHAPEQVHISFAGPGAMTISWVTWPQEDEDAYEYARKSYLANLEIEEQEETIAVLSSSRKLQLKNWPRSTSFASLANGDLSRHHHHRRHRHRRHHRHRREDSERDPDPAGNCHVLDQMKLESAVQWGTAPGNYTHLVYSDNGDDSDSIDTYNNFDCYSTTAYLSGALHHVVIGEKEGPLPAATAIYYRVGDPSRDTWSEEKTFTTPPRGNGDRSLPYRLGLVGDLGQTEHSSSTLEHLVGVSEEKKVDSVLFVGDLSYADGYQPRWDTWGRLVEPYTSSMVWMYTQGNHEIEPSNVAPDFLSYSKRFRLPHKRSGSSSNLYYSYEIAGIHVIMLGSYAPFDESSDQYAWLRKDLESVDRIATPWVIASMHAPWYNSNHNHYGDGEEMRISMESVLYEHGVDAVVAGHVHAYERSQGVFNNENDPCGPHYINIGDGGNREGLDFDYYKPQPEWSAMRDPSYGHAVIDFVNSTTAVYQWHRNQDGVEEVADEFVLTRDPKCRVNGGLRLQAKKTKGSSTYKRFSRQRHSI